MSLLPAMLRSHATRARGVLLVVALVLSIYWFAKEVNPHYPIEQWMFWVYARVWVWCGLFALACASGGNLIMRAIGGATLPLRERLVMTLGLGTLGFFYLLFVGGILGLYGPTFAVAMPMLLVAAGAIPLMRLVRKVGRHLRAARARSRKAQAWWFYPALAFGGLGVAMVYFNILTPRNVAFDAHFYHLGLAQQYAVQGGIRATPEGWVPAAIPHLASVFYAWTFIVPGLDMFERMITAAHLEFVIFLMTLGSIPVLVRWLVPDARTSASWAALFLFPGIHVYDSTVSAAADHICAFWAIPIFLAFVRFWRSVSRRDAVLLAAMLSGALLTKYQSMYFLPLIVGAVAGRVLWSSIGLMRRTARPEAVRRTLAAVGVVALAGLVLTAPHWLRNWVFYGDPLYPYLNRFFPSSRWVPDVPRLFADWNHWQMRTWTPQGTLSERLVETGDALVFFSFEPHDWPNFHGKWPVFGSLFTLSLPLLLFVRGAKRTWALAVATLLGVALWFWTMHQDRYLQLLVPWMACVVAATIALCWRSHWTAKPLVAALVAFQVIWGGDAYFIPSHAMTKKATMHLTADLLEMGYHEKYDERFDLGGGLFAIGRDEALPPDATILLHENNPRLGLWRPVVMDVAGWQYGMRYELFDSAAALDGRLRDYGVTHILTRAAKSRGYDSLGADLRFFGYVTLNATKVKSFGELTLYAMPESPPSPPPLGDRVAYLGCGKQYERGLHPIGQLHVRDAQAREPPGKIAAERAAPRDAGGIAGLVAEAAFAVTDDHCKPTVPGDALRDFVKIAVRKNYQLWARQRPREE